MSVRVYVCEGVWSGCGCGCGCVGVACMYAICVSGHVGESNGEYPTYIVLVTFSPVTNSRGGAWEQGYVVQGVLLTSATTLQSCLRMSSTLDSS